MGLQKNHDEDRRNEKRKAFAVIQALVFPDDQLCHQPGCVKRRGGLKNHAKALSIWAKRLDMVGEVFVFAAMTFILSRVF